MLHRLNYFRKLTHYSVNTLRSHDYSITNIIRTIDAPAVTPINLKKYIEKITPELKPPVANKLIFGGDIKVMVVGGPNARSDYHVEMGEELFYQLKGRMELEIVQNNRRRCIPIEEGQMFLLPAGIPHSPQRFADSIGLVFERERDRGELDAMRWYHETNQYDDPLVIQYEEYFHCTDLGTQIKEAIENYQSMLAGDLSASENKQKISPPQLNVDALNHLVDLYPLQLPFAYGTETSKASMKADAGAGHVHKILDSEFSVYLFSNRNSERIDEGPSFNYEEEVMNSTAIKNSRISRTEIDLTALGANEVFFWQESGTSQISRLIGSAANDRSSTWTDECMLHTGDACIIRSSNYNGEKFIIEQQGDDDRLMAVWNHPGRTLPKKSKYLPPIQSIEGKR